MRTGAIDRFPTVPGTESSLAVAATSRSPHISYVIARLERALRKEIGRLVGPRGLSVAQYTTLSILRSRSGLSNAQMAKHLWVTEQTIKFHLSNIYRKIGIRNRTAASRWAQANGLLEDANEA